MYKKCGELFKVQRGQPLPAGLDPHDNTTQDTFTEDQLLMMVINLLCSSLIEDKMFLSALLWACYSAGRGDEQRQRRMADLCAPAVRNSISEWQHLPAAVCTATWKAATILQLCTVKTCSVCSQMNAVHSIVSVCCLCCRFVAEPMKCYAVAVVERVGKTLGDSGVHLKAVIRHANPLLCAQRAFGAHIICRFTLLQEPFPDPTSAEWQSVYIWPGSNPMKAMRYRAHNAAYTEAFKAGGVVSRFHTTHAPRLFAPRKAKDGGAPDQVSMLRCRSLLITLLLVSAAYTGRPVHESTSALLETVAGHRCDGGLEPGCAPVNLPGAWHIATDAHDHGQLAGASSWRLSGSISVMLAVTA